MMARGLLATRVQRSVISATWHMNEEGIYYLAMTWDSSTTITSTTATQQSYNYSLNQTAATT